MRLASDIFHGTPEQRMEMVLQLGFRGIHHVEKIEKNECVWIAKTNQSLSTFDYDLLTRLVLAAHQYCVRLEIQTNGFHGFKILLWPRKGRTGAFRDRHPTIQQAIEQYET